MMNINSELLDYEYNPRATIPDFAAVFSRWKTDASAARASLRGRLDLCYGESAAETLDLFPAQGTGRPLLIFLHGGYWRALDKSDFSWLAPPYVEAGISVAVVNYGLLPSTPLAEIVRQSRRACAWLYRNGVQLGLDTGSFICSGHSAGGHLTAMMLATDWPALRTDLPRRLLAAGLTLSGVFDVTPLTHAEFLCHDLQLDVDQARQLSPAFLPWHNEAPLVRAVGALETSEFKRQSALMEEHWPRACTQPVIHVPGANHFSVCDALASTNGPLWAAVQNLFSNPP